ncbi:hypothetical protein ACVXZZ_12765 [Staphylococcus aureus]
MLIVFVSILMIIGGTLWIMKKKL